MSLLKKYEEFDEEYCKALNEYYALHKSLDEFRGIDITDEVAAKANPIIMAIQEKYIEIEPCIEWGIQRYSSCARLRLEFNEFVDHIKKGGAQTINSSTKEAQA
jgi:hypothetical protein